MPTSLLERIYGKKESPQIAQPTWDPDRINRLIREGHGYAFLASFNATANKVPVLRLRNTTPSLVYYVFYAHARFLTARGWRLRIGTTAELAELTVEIPQSLSSGPIGARGGLSFDGSGVATGNAFWGVASCLANTLLEYRNIIVVPPNVVLDTTPDGTANGDACDLGLHWVEDRL